jgi:tRNA nucleotidyltransferase/poly(A) polymerase
VIEVYEVGGSVRDKLLGLKIKDRDFSVVSTQINIEDAWKEMVDYVNFACDKIYLTTPDCFTIRAMHPTIGPVDYVLARREEYTEDSRKPTCLPGTLYDDLVRRDFTVNVIAIDTKERVIDYFNGLIHLNERVLVCPLDNPKRTFKDDPLRALRAIRFCVTKDFEYNTKIRLELEDQWLVEYTQVKVSAERIREELLRCFSHDTIGTLDLLAGINVKLRNYWLTAGGMWLMPTFEKPK